MTEEETELFHFGVIADTQYCDTDDGFPFDKQATRRYRRAYDIMSEACAVFQRHEIKYCIHLGDVIDGKCLRLGIEEECMKKMHDLMTSQDQTWHVSFGNHDFYNFDRDRIFSYIPSYIRDKEKDLSPLRLYYSFSPSSGVRFIMLDPFEISTFAATSSKHTDSAKKLLEEKNKNLSIPNSDWSHGLEEDDLKYVPYNGSLSENQLCWLQETLKQADRDNEICFIFSHISLYKPCARPSGLIWNHDAVLDVIHTHGKTVAAVISGHDHNGGYAVDEKGIHHIVPPAPLECELHEVAYGYITLHPTNFELSWFGRVPSTAGSTWPTAMTYRARTS